MKSKHASLILKRSRWIPSILFIMLMGYQSPSHAQAADPHRQAIQNFLALLNKVNNKPYPPNQGSLPRGRQTQERLAYNPPPRPSHVQPRPVILDTQENQHRRIWPTNLPQNNNRLGRRQDQGLISQSAKMHGIALAEVNFFNPLVRMHDTVLSNLPRNVKAYFICNNANAYRKAYPQEFATGRFVDMNIATDSTWIRDYFPEVVTDRNGHKRLVQFEYMNGYPTAKHVAQQVANYYHLPLETCRLKGEWGNICKLQDGTVLATNHWLHANPNLSQQEIEQRLKQSLNVKKIDWLPTLPNETTGHVDLFVKEVIRGGNKTLLIAQSQNPSRHQTLARVAEHFRQQGFIQRGYQIRRIMNAESASDNARTLSYINSMTINNTAFVPQYFDPTIRPDDYLYQENLAFQRRDQQACQTYRDLGFHVVQVPALRMAEYGGSAHCLYKHLPTELFH